LKYLNLNPLFPQLSNNYEQKELKYYYNLKINRKLVYYITFNNIQWIHYNKDLNDVNLD